MASKGITIIWGFEGWMGFVQVKFERSFFFFLTQLKQKHEEGKRKDDLNGYEDFF